MLSKYGDRQKINQSNIVKKGQKASTCPSCGKEIPVISIIKNATIFTKCPSCSATVKIEDK